jgi:hypothetical protein
MDEMEKDGVEDRRPMSVRAAMEVSEPDEEDRGSLRREFCDPKTDQDWVVRISGRSMSGVLPLRVIPLMELNFSRSEEPDVPLRRAIYQGESMDELDDSALLSLFRSAGPFESKAPE